MIYKVIAKIGTDSYLDSCIYCTYKAAMQSAYNMIQNEECDSVIICSELPDKETGRYRTYQTLQTLTKPF